MPRQPELPSRITPQLEERAAWIVQSFADHPTLTFAERCRTARRHFQIGKVAAELAYKRALELRREYTNTVVATYRDHVITASLEDEAAARAAGDYRTANRIRMDLARMLGLHAAEKVEVTVKPRVVADLPELTDEQLEAMERAGVIAAPALPPLDDGVIDVEGVEVVAVELDADPSHGAAEPEPSGDDERVSVAPDPDTVG